MQGQREVCSDNGDRKKSSLSEGAPGKDVNDLKMAYTNPWGIKAVVGRKEKKK